MSTNGNEGPLLPEDGIEAMVKDMGDRPDVYPALRPLRQRGPTQLHLGKGSDDRHKDDYAFSRTIVLAASMTERLFGFLRDCSIEDPDEAEAIMSLLELSVIFLDAPCVNRQALMEEWDRRSDDMLRLLTDDEDDDEEDEDEDLDGEGLDDDEDEDEEEDEATTTRRVSRRQRRLDAKAEADKLLHRWSKQDAFMLRCRIIEERDGIDAARPLWERHATAKARKRAIEIEASELAPGANLYFWCQVEKQRIARETDYDVEMGHPHRDYSAVKKSLAEGKSIHDVAHMMPWAFLEGYTRAMASRMDGEAYWQFMAALQAGQGMPQAMPPWAMNPYMGMGMGMGAPWQNGQMGGEDGEDKRPAIIKWMGGGGGQNQQNGRKKWRRKKGREE